MPRIDATNWIEQTEQACREIVAPDLDGCGCYIVIGEDLPAQHQLAGIGGFTSLSLPMALRPWLESQGRWTGPGFACVVYPNRLAQPGVSAMLVLWFAINAVFHELSHWVEYTAAARQLSAVTGSVSSAVTASAFSQAAITEMLATPIPKSAMPWGGHSVPFIRAAIHTFARARDIGWDVSLQAMRVAGSEYALSDARDYAATLSDELAALRSVPLVEAMCTPAPASIEQLFASDTMRGSNGTR